MMITMKHNNKILVEIKKEIKSLKIKLKQKQKFKPKKIKIKNKFKKK